MGTLTHHHLRNVVIFITMMLSTLIACDTQAQTYNFKSSGASGKRVAHDFHVHGFPDTITVWCNEFNYMNTHATTWGNDLKFKSNNSFVSFYVDHAYPLSQRPYTYKMTYQIYGYSTMADTTIYTLGSDTLTISSQNNVDPHGAFQDIQLAKFSGYYKTMVIITGIYDVNTGANADMTDTLKWNFGVESSIITQRYDKRHSGTTYYGAGTSLQTTEYPHPAENYLGVYFNFTSGDTSQLLLTPVNYELEWAYVDNYRKDPVSGALSTKSASSLNYDFTNNCTRVWLKDNRYKIPLVYSNGYIVYRVRMVRPDSLLYEYPLQSDWSYNTANTGTISSINSNCRYQITNSVLHDSLNWQYTISFAEEGKYKHVMSFYDGLLKNRESITRFNSDLNRLIVTRSIYDFEGRPSIVTLPAPVLSSSFSFLHNVDLAMATHLPYRADYFDTGFHTCPVDPLLSPLADDALANIYYSRFNYDTFGVQKYVPDAQGFPMVQTIYSPAFNNRIDKQGGAGPHLQVADSNIVTNYYVGTERSFTDKLFGLNAGWNSFYNKTISRDQNQQLSLSVKNYKGEIAATAMIGRGANPADHAISPIGVPDSTSYHDDLLDNLTQTITGNTRTADRDFFNEAEGNDSLQYVLNMPPFPICDRFMSLKAHYMYNLTDQCGNVLYQEDSTIGTSGFVTTPFAYAGPVVSLHLDQAPYSVHKELTFSTDDMDTVLAALFAGPNCFRTRPQFIRSSVESYTFPCLHRDDPIESCADKRQEMLAELHPGAKYGVFHLNASGAVEGSDNSIFTMVAYDTVIVHGNGVPVYHYRYQDSCTNFTLSDTITVAGITYYNLRTMSADSFIAIYNQSISEGDPIAEALLPLHPEYCKLLNCFDDSFKIKVEALYNADNAEGQNLLLLDSLIAHDPAVAHLSLSLPSPADSLRTFRGGFIRLDSFELMTDYCGCSDSVMFNECVAHIYNYEITHKILANDDIKTKYFEHIRSSYLDNRQRYLDLQTASVSDDCPHCSDVRMNLIPMSVFPAVDTSGGSAWVTPSFPGDTAWSGLGFASSFLTSYSSLPSLDSMTDTTLLAFLDTATTISSGADSMLCNSQIVNIMERLANCGDGDTMVLHGIRNTLDSLCAHHVISMGAYTPELIRYAILRNGGSLNDFCNPYLIMYGSVMPTLTTPDGDCKTDSFYRSVKVFLNRPQVIAALRTTGTLHSTTLNTVSNIFEISAYNVIGNTAIQMFASYDATHNLYKLKVYSDPSVAVTGDSVTIYLRGAATCTSVFAGGDSVKVGLVACISTAPSFTSLGLIRDYSFIAQADVYTGSTINSCLLLSWTDTIITMNAGNNPLVECVPCTEMKKLYTQFTDSLHAVGIWGTDHPMYSRMLMSFMNYRLQNTFAEDQYETFIESCALADSMVMPQYLGYSSAQFANDANADSFIAMLNRVDTNIDLSGYYRDSASRITVSINFNSFPESEFWRYRNAIRQYTGPYTALVIDTLFSKLYLGQVGGGTPPSSFEIGYMFCPLGTALPSPSAIFGSGTTCSFVSGGVRGLWMSGHYSKQDYYKVVYTSGMPSAYQLSRDVYELNRYIYNNNLSYIFSANYQSTINQDYYEPRKQEYLAYTYSHQALPSYEVLDSVQAQYLLARIPGYAGKEASYNSAAHPGIVTDLYVADSTMMGPGLDTLKYILHVVADTNTANPGHIFFGPTDVGITYNGSLHAYRCSDGTYWYRYFGVGDTMWNVFVLMPPWVPQSTHTQYTIVSAGPPVGIVPTLGDSTTRYFALNLRNDLDGSIIQARGLASFVIGHNLEMDNVLLGNPMMTYVARRDATIHNCETDLLAVGVNQGIVNYNDYIDSIKSAVRAAFAEWVNTNIDEHLYLSYLNQQFQYTLYYYDRAGNLNATVPPAGVQPLPPSSFTTADNARSGNYYDAGGANTHAKVSTYEHNTLNQVVKQITPDGGTVSFIYDYAGRLLLSQNEKQYPEGYYTYNLYDHQSRIIETGEAKLACPYFDEYLVEFPYSLPDCYFSYYEPHGGIPFSRISPYSPIIRRADEMPHDSIIAYIYSIDRRDVVHTIYDTAAMDLSVADGMEKQVNLRKRVSAVKYFRHISALDSLFLTYLHATHYSYDAAGNVKTLVQDYPKMEFLRQRYKRVDYDYDLISGKVNMLSYNRSFADQFYQRYEYDADNRLTKTETSGDGIIWHRDAEYTYYKHGPLARLDVGDLRVQGIDYAYTIQGWLKTINADSTNPAMDMGRDADLTINARDAAAFSIDYFKGDYKPITSWKQSHVQDVVRNLYNGNIARQTMAYTSFQKLHKQYVYDQLNRLKTAEYATVNTTDSLINPIPDYASSYDYDADGNIQRLLRYGNNAGTGAHIMDSLFYTYSTGSDGYTPNQLKSLMDAAPDTYTNDVKFNTTGLPSYLYDKIGNTTKDLVSGQDSIEWNLYNKVTQTRNINDSNWLNFDYDAHGNRVAKYFTQKVDSGVMEHNDFYVHDATGNILATYHEDAKYKKEHILWIDLITEPYWAVAAHRGINSGFVAPVFAANNDFQQAILGFALGNEDFKKVELDKPMSFFLHRPALYADVMAADPSYIVPLTEYEMAGNHHIIGNSLSKLALNDKRSFTALLTELMKDSLAAGRVLKLLCDAGNTKTMEALAAHYGIDLKAATACGDQADKIMQLKSGLPDLARDIYIHAKARSYKLDQLLMAVVKDMESKDPAQVDSIYRHLFADPGTRRYVLDYLCSVGYNDVMKDIALGFGVDTLKYSTCSSWSAAVMDSSATVPGTADSMCRHLRSHGQQMAFTSQVMADLESKFPDMLVDLLGWMIADPGLRTRVFTGLCGGFPGLAPDLAKTYNIDVSKISSCVGKWNLIVTKKYNTALPGIAADLAPLLVGDDRLKEYTRLLAVDSVIHDSLLVQPAGKRYIGRLQSTLADYGYKARLLEFFDQYDGAHDMLMHVAQPKRLLNICYTTNTVEFLCNMDSLMGHDYIDTAMAAVPDMEPQPYAAKLTASLGTLGVSASAATAMSGPGTGAGGPPPAGGAGGSGGLGLGGASGTLSPYVMYGAGGFTTIPTWDPYAWANIIQHTNFYLAEHDIYGSSRLGVKKYWPRQVNVAWDFTHGSADTVTLWQRKPWYSLEVQDMTMDTALTPYARMHTDKFITQHITGQKQYEFKDHLGNVLATISDARIPACDTAGDTTVPFGISYYKPVIQSANDYYPFGMLMPGRYTSDTTIHTASVTATVLVPVALPGIIIDTFLPVHFTGSAVASSGAGGAYTLLRTYAYGEGATWHIGPLTPGVPQEIVVSTSSATVPYRASLVSGATTGVMHTIPTGLSMPVHFSFVPIGNFVDIEIADDRAFGGSTGMESIQVYYFQIDTVNYTPQTVVTTITSGDDYHFGFNGKYKDNEWAGLGNSLDFGARMYDSRIGRWRAVDPLKGKYPGFSPYNFGLNNPIRFADADGKWVRDQNGNVIFTPDAKLNAENSNDNPGGRGGRYILGESFPVLVITGTWGHIMANDGTSIEVFVPNSKQVLQYLNNEKSVDVTEYCDGEKNCTSNSLLPSTSSIVISAEQITDHILNVEGFVKSSDIQVGAKKLADQGDQAAAHYSPDNVTQQGDIVVYGSGSGQYEHFEYFLDNKTVDTKGGVQKGPIKASPGKNRAFNSPLIWFNTNVAGWRDTKTSAPAGSTTANGQTTVTNDQFNKIQEDVKKAQETATNK